MANYIEIRTEIADYLTNTAVNDTRVKKLVTNAQKEIRNFFVKKPQGALFHMIRRMDTDTLPSISSLTESTGGTLTAATYSYRVSAVNALGETLASTASTIVVSGGTASVILIWTDTPGATSYNVYGRDSGTELLIASSTTLTYTDTGALTPAGALPTATTYVTVAADTQTIALPNDYEKLEYMSFINTTTSTRFNIVPRFSQRSFAHNTSDIGTTNTSRPAYFTRLGDNIKLDSPTDIAYGLEFSWTAKFLTLAEDKDTNWLTLNEDKLLIFGALVEAIPFVEQDPRASTWETIFNKKLQDLWERDLAERRSGQHDDDIRGYGPNEPAFLSRSSRHGNIIADSTGG